MSHMGISLVESAKLSQDMLQKGFIGALADNSVVLDRIPFIEVVGNGYSYNLAEELPNVGFRTVNEGYRESGATILRETEMLVILGGDVDVDMFIQQTRGNINDIRAVQTELKAKAVAERYTEMFFNGNTMEEAYAFDGLIPRLEKGKGTKIRGAFKKPTTEADALVIVDALYDLLEGCEGAKADVIYASPKNRRVITRALHMLGYNTGTGVDAFGKEAIMFNGVPIVVVPTALGDTHIIAVKYGNNNVIGLTNGGVQVRDIGEAHDKPVLRTRVEFYCGLAVLHPKSFSALEITSTLSKAK